MKYIRQGVFIMIPIPQTPDDIRRSIYAILYKMLSRSKTRGRVPAWFRIVFRGPRSIPTVFYLFFRFLSLSSSVDCSLFAASLLLEEKNLSADWRRETS